jgi:hypothetical protein
MLYHDMVLHPVLILVQLEWLNFHPRCERIRVSFRRTHGRRRGLRRVVKVGVIWGVGGVPGIPSGRGACGASASRKRNCYASLSQAGLAGRRERSVVGVGSGAS